MKTFLFKRKIKNVTNQLINSDFKPNDYRYFLEVTKAHEWGKFYFGKWANYIETIHSENYSNDYFSCKRAIDYYCGYVFKKINRHLRLESINEEVVYFKEITGHLDNEFIVNKCPENIVVVRWVNSKKFTDANSITKTEIIEDKGYISTSLHLGFISDTIDNKERDISKEILMLIKIPKDSRMLYVNDISKRNNEQEILLPRNTRLQINKAYKTIFNNKILLCTVI